MATDFFTAEVLTTGGLLTLYVLFFIHLATRKVHIAGITEYPDEEWMKQIARNITWEDSILSDKEYLIHDRDPLFTTKFRSILKSSGLEPVKLPPRSPNLNAFAERFIRSIKEECLNHLILTSEQQLQHVLLLEK